MKPCYLQQQGYGQLGCSTFLAAVIARASDPCTNALSQEMKGPKIFNSTTTCGFRKMQEEGLIHILLRHLDIVCVHPMQQTCLQTSFVQITTSLLVPRLKPMFLQLHDNCTCAHPWKTPLSRFCNSPLAHANTSALAAQLPFSCDPKSP